MLLPPLACHETTQPHHSYRKEHSLCSTHNYTAPQTTYTLPLQPNTSPFVASTVPLQSGFVPFPRTNLQQQTARQNGSIYGTLHFNQPSPYSNPHQYQVSPHHLYNASAVNLQGASRNLVGSPLYTSTPRLVPAPTASATPLGMPKEERDLAMALNFSNNGNSATAVLRNEIWNGYATPQCYRREYRPVKREPTSPDPDHTPPAPTPTSCSGNHETSPDGSSLTGGQENHLDDRSSSLPTSSGLVLPPVEQDNGEPNPSEVQVRKRKPSFLIEDILRHGKKSRRQRDSGQDSGLGSSLDSTKRGNSSDVCVTVDGDAKKRENGSASSGEEEEEKTEELDVGDNDCSDSGSSVPSINSTPSSESDSDPPTDEKEKSKKASTNSREQP